MGGTISYDEQLGVAIVEVVGRVGDAELDAQRAELEALPAFHGALPVLVDWSRLEQRGVTPDLIRRRAWRPWPVSGRIAFYAPTDVLFGLARMYAQMSDQPIEVFRDREKALAWLGAED